jgi:hypothetical protein
MSKGGSFNVIINEQNPDDMINNSKRLLERLSEFNKRAEGFVLSPSDPNYISMQNSVTPIINFLEHTHHVFVNGSFKPHVPIAFQYTIVKAANPTLGSRIQFDIKPYGDFWSDMVLNIKLTGLSAVDPRDRVRYISQVGHRVGSLFEFSFQGITMDQYDYNYYNIYRQFNVLPEKRAGWDRCMGQEVPLRGFLTPDPYVDMFREYRTVGVGHQTLKQNQDDLDLWIPILFWFRDVRYAFPQIIADGQTNLTITLAQPQDLVGAQDLGGGGKYYSPKIATCALYVNNLFMQEDVFQLFLKNFNFSLIRVSTYQINTINSNAVNFVKLYGIKFPVEDIFIGFRPQANLALSQYWNKYCTLTSKKIPTAVLMQDPNVTWTGTTISATNTNQITIAGLGLSTINNYYINYIFVLTGGTGYNAADITQNRYTVAGWDPTTNTVTLSSNWTGFTPNTTTTWEMYTLQLGTGYIQCYEESEIVDSLELRAFDISIRGPWSSNFYSRYIPMHYGPHMNSADGPGWYIIPFNLYPMNMNPSGYIDFTQSRENYLYWTSTSISESNPVDLITYSRSMNFLILVNNQASLRYT